MVNSTTRKVRSQTKNGKSGKGTSRKPDFVVRPGNGVSVAVYQDTIERDGEDRTVYSITTRKAYKNSEGNWDHVYSLYPSDLLQASWALEKAFEWINDQSNA